MVTNGDMNICLGWRHNIHLSPPSTAPVGAKNSSELELSTLRERKKEK